MVDLLVTLSIWDSIMAAGSALMQPLYWAVSGLIEFFNWLFTPLLGKVPTLERIIVAGSYLIPQYYAGSHRMVYDAWRLVVPPQMAA